MRDFARSVDPLRGAWGEFEHQLRSPKDAIFVHIKRFSFRESASLT